AFLCAAKVGRQLPPMEQGLRSISDSHFRTDGSVLQLLRVWRTPRPHQAIPESSRMNADDCLSLDPLGRVEGGNRIVEGSHVADVCPQPTNPDPLDELTQLGSIGYDDE